MKMKSYFSCTGLLLAWITVTSCPCPAELPSGVREVTQVEGITEYRLENGLQVLLYPDNSKPTFTVNVTYRVGSRHEGRGETGMAHLLEHMVFKGTPTFPNIWGALEDHGASFNGTTWVDRTNYFETLPASEENLRFALKMEADRMVNSEILASELAKEMTVVRNEFEQGENNPEGILSERMLSAAYLWHNYGKSTIGNRSDIERVPVANLKRFYKKYYQPDNATLLVAGNFDPQQTLRWIVDEFGKIPRPERTLDATYTEEPTQDGARHVTLKRVGDVPAVGLVYHIPAGAHPEFPAVQLLQSILTSEPSGRLYRRLVIPGLASRVSGAAFAWAEPGVIELGAAVTPQSDPQEVLNYMIETVENIAQAPITAEEVERAKLSALKQIKLAMTDSGRIGVYLSEYIAQGDWRLFFIHRDRIEQVTPADVQRAAVTYLKESNRTSGIFFPTKEIDRAPIPTTPDIRPLVENYRGKQQIAEGVGLKPEVEYIEQRVQRLQLPSGIKLALLPMETRGDAVWLSMRLHFGNETELTGRTDEVNLISSMLMRGTRKRTFQQLQDEIDRLQSQIVVGGLGGAGRGRGGFGPGGGGPGVVPAFIQSDRQHLPAAIKLLAEIFQQPAFDPAEFKTIKAQRRSMLERMQSEPQALGMLELSRKMSPWPPESIHYVPTLAESLERLERATLEGVQELYQRLFGANHVEIAVVGDFNVEQVKQTLEQSFGSWKSQAPYERIARPYRDHAADQVLIHTPDKAMAVVGMGAAVEMRDSDPRYPAMTLASYVLGQSAKSRLMNRLRHQGGLSYGAGAFCIAGDQDPVGQLLAFAICAPQNAPTALQAMQEEIRKWIDQGLTESELDEAKNSYALRFKRQLASEQYLAGELCRGLELGRTLQFDAEILAKIQQLSLTDVQSAIRSVFGNQAMVTMMAGAIEDGPTSSAKDEPRTTGDGAPTTAIQAGGGPSARRAVAILKGSQLPFTVDVNRAEILREQ